MWRNGRFIPINKRRHVYHAYVQSHLNYMLPIYSQGSITKMTELKILQNRCIKALYRLPRDTPTTYLYSSNLIPLELLITIERISQLHKMVLNYTKHNFALIANNNFHGRVGIHTNSLHLFKDQPILTDAIANYNRLSDDFHQIRNISAFKSRLRDQLIKKSDGYHGLSPFLFLNWPM